MDDAQTHTDGRTGAGRRVLVIAYYFPPMGLSGVQRVAKFVRYLPHYGWHPDVLTVEPAGYFAYDETLLHEVEDADPLIRRTRSFDPTRLFGKRTVPMPSETRRRWWSFLTNLLFVPDNKIGWIPFALRAGHRMMRTHRYDAILSSAPPYTAHLVGARLSRRHGVPLVVDFRDDWVGNPRHVYPSRLHRWAHQRLERHVLRRACHALTINEPIRQGLVERNRTAGWAPDVRVLPQGFDPADFASADFDRCAPSRTGERLRLVYTGVFYDAQTPDPFLRALADFVAYQPEVRSRVEAVFVGIVPEASQRLADRLGIADMIRYEGYRTHEATVQHQRDADVLWLTVGRRPGAEGISTGKLFEYFGARKPILALVPEGAAQDALVGHGAALIVPPDDVDAIRQGLRICYQQWSAGALPVPDEAHVRRFDRQRLAGELAEILESSRTA